MVDRPLARRRALAEPPRSRAGLPDEAVTELRRAALVHDIGRVGVPNTIWDKPGPLTDTERERVRLHSYYTERMLARPASLARLGAIAACHHERLDGSGYHRALPGSALSPAARVLAAADAYQAMTEPRPYRPALEPRQAAAELRADVRAGRLDGDAAEEVLAAPGTGAQPPRACPTGRPDRPRAGGARARGARCDGARRGTRAGIADKTARNHIERIYSKLGVSTRGEPRCSRCATGSSSCSPS